ncbi:surface protein [Marinitenerispora sediminis]|uniref:Surface protein n=1 Tax=Marinitenerispora sediminis TaxID=1931232 RepID=A0A368T4U0_9ACTN|nr:surface protein [Marinitenerispora sediminis]RCV55519.1 surface protein [Marinitenerispora sediminis]RCV58073.1 surface protein [Marinitenerispora sediminis]
MRRGRALLAAVLLLGWCGLGWYGAAPARAEADTIARVDRNGVAGETVHFAGEGAPAAATALFNLRVGDAAGLPAYCVDLGTDVDQRAPYVEADWADLPAGRAVAARPDPVLWIVTHSYPHVGLADLRAAAGIGSLDEAQAIAGTQAAIWHFSNGVDLRTEGLTHRNSAEVEALYRYLVANAAAAGPVPEPPPSLALEPGVVRGDSAEPLGPFTVRTTSEGPVRLTVNGVRAASLVDGAGDPVTSAVDGAQVLLRLEPGTPEGSAKVYADSDAVVVSAGRLFVGRDGVKTQPLVAADSATVSATVSATANWTADPPSAAPAGPEPSPPTAPGASAGAPPPAATAPRPTPAPRPEPDPSPLVIAEDKRPDADLPFTGTWLGTVLLAGSASLVAGAVVMVLGYRRRR